jgi:hypothetical protein
VIDLIGPKAKFRYGVEQRNFFGLTAELNGLTAELNGLTAELQRNF